MKLSKKVQYSLVALVHLDRIAPGSRVSAHELAERYGIPAAHLGKVLQRLSRAGILRAIHGVQGGYELAKPLSDLSLGSLMEAVEGRRGADPSRPHAIVPGFPACYAQGLAHEVERQVSAVVASLNLATLLPDVRAPALNPSLEIPA